MIVGSIKLMSHAVGDVTRFPSASEEFLSTTLFANEISYTRAEETTSIANIGEGQTVEPSALKKKFFAAF